MTKNFVGTVLVIIMVMLAFLGVPLYYTGITQYAKAQQQVLNETQIFLDKVADTGQLTQADLDDFTLGLQSYLPVAYSVTKEERQVNPDPASTTPVKETYTSWVACDKDDIYDYSTGDIVTVEVRQTSDTLYQVLATKVFRQYVGNVDFKLSRMVR
jgi:hypothetical protein